jgi:hypothetical protein
MDFEEELARNILSKYKFDKKIQMGKLTLSGQQYYGIAELLIKEAIHESAIVSRQACIKELERLKMIEEEQLKRLDLEKQYKAWTGCENRRVAFALAIAQLAKQEGKEE